MVFLRIAVSAGERGLGWPMLCPVGSSSAELAVEEQKGYISMLQGMSTLEGVTTWVEIFLFWAGNHRIYPGAALR